MRVMKFSNQISHIPGKNLVTTEAISRVRSPHISAADYRLETEVNVHVNAIIFS